MKFLIAFAFFGLVAFPVLSQEKKDTIYNPNNPDLLVEHFFQLFMEESIDEALDFLYSAKHFQENESLQENIVSMKEQLNNLEETLGALYSYSRVQKLETGDRLVSYSYLLNYKRRPLSMVFVYYMPDDQWELLQFQYSDEVIDVLIDRMQYLRTLHAR